ncbi:MAG TPA: hypothetical protein VGZ00_06545 [Candidatus Baltobacteraceae bacterium]|nr:hypothetical protein [Candidatus Baltobacteraceae bacterium]
MPLTKLQIHILALIAAGRSPDSYIAGGLALNRDRPRITDDIDIFHDSAERLQDASEADAKALMKAGLPLSLKKIQAGKRDAEIEWMGDKVRLEWVHDCAFRFFPTQPDKLFGYVLHPVDLATNKASAAAARRVPRDIVDLVTIHENILPLGAVICAAVGRFLGQSPEEVLDDIQRHSRYSEEDFRSLPTSRPIDVRDLHRRINTMIEAGEHFIKKMPSEAVGVVFLEGGKPVQPNPKALEKYQRHAGSLGGTWPSSEEISNAMLDGKLRRQEEHSRRERRWSDGGTSSTNARHRI